MMLARKLETDEHAELTKEAVSSGERVMKAIERLQKKLDEASPKKEEHPGHD